MATYVLYLDDSWSKHEQAFVLAGYLAPIDLWENDFCPKWRAALESTSHPSAEFHAADCRHLQGEFRGWTRRNADNLTRRVVGVIADELPKADIVGLGAAVVLPGAPMPSHARVWQEAAFTVSFTWSMVLALEVALLAMQRGDTVRIVVDDKPKFHRLMEANWASIWRELAPYAAEKTVVPPTFAKSHDALPIQAADLLAYETAHEAKQRVSPGPRPVSAALRRLVEGKHHQANCIWYPDLQERVAIQASGGQCPTGGTLLFRSDFQWRAPDQWPYLRADAQADGV